MQKDESSLVNVKENPVERESGKGECEKDPVEEVAEHQTQLEKGQEREEASSSNVSTVPSSARRRWMLLSSKVIRSSTANTTQQQPEPDPDGFKSFGFFILSALGELSSTGCWYRLISPVNEQLHLELHFVDSSRTSTLTDLVGYDNTGNVRLWPSEECLAEYVLLNPHVCEGKSVLELGAGMTGMAGLVALLAGAGHVYLTDGNAKAVHNLELIVTRNHLESCAKALQLDWSAERVPRLFDTVLCADCLFFTNSHLALLGCIHAHLNQHGVAYIMAPARKGTALQFLKAVYEERQRWSDVHVVFQFQPEIQRRINTFLSQLIYEPDVHTPILFVLRK